VKDGFGPAWAQFKDRATAIITNLIAPVGCGAIEVALTIHDQARNGIGAIAVRPGKAVQDGFGPAWAQLENRAFTIRAAFGGSAIEVASTVHDQARRRPHTIVVCIAEAVKDGFPPVWAQLKNCPAAQRAVGAAATDRSPIEVSRAVHDQGRVGGRAVVLLFAKRVKDFFSTARADSKDCPRVILASKHRDAIEVSRAVDDETSVGVIAIAIGAREAVEDGFGPARAQLKDGAVTIRAAKHGGAVEIARAVHDHSRRGIISIAICARKAVEDTFGCGVRGLGTNEQRRGKSS